MLDKKVTIEIRQKVYYQLLEIQALKNETYSEIIAPLIIKKHEELMSSLNSQNTGGVIDDKQ